MSDLAGVPLFSYGILRYENVQMASFGRLLQGVPDALSGYVCVQIKIKDTDVVKSSGEQFHPMIVETGNPADVVRGTVFSLSDVELAAADACEASDCKRVQLTLTSGRCAWVYVRA